MRTSQLIQTGNSPVVRAAISLAMPYEYAHCPRSAFTAAGAAAPRSRYLLTAPRGAAGIWCSGDPGSTCGLCSKRAGETRLEVQDPDPGWRDGNARHRLAAKSGHPCRALLRAEVPLG